MLFIVLRIEKCTSDIFIILILEYTMHNSWKWVYFRPLFRQESTTPPPKKKVSPVQNHGPTGVTAHQIHSFFHATSAPRTFPGQQWGWGDPYGDCMQQKFKNDSQTWAVHSSIVFFKYIEVNLLIEPFLMYNKKKRCPGILSLCVFEGCFGTNERNTTTHQIYWAFKLIINIPDKNA